MEKNLIASFDLDAVSLVSDDVGGFDLQEMGEEMPHFLAVEEVAAEVADDCIQANEVFDDASELLELEEGVVALEAFDGDDASLGLEIMESKVLQFDASGELMGEAAMDAMSGGVAPMSVSSTATPPPAPTNLRLNGSATTSSIPLIWNASAGATSYDIFISGSFLGNVAGTAANVTGLAAGTSYSFTVRARNAVGSSGNSNTLNARTLANTSVPAAPTNLRLNGSATTSSIPLIWNASAGATSYDIFISGSFLGNVAVAAANITGLAAGTSYSFTVRARNAVGSSGNSNTLNAWTLANTSVPAAPTNLRLNGSATTSSIPLIWNASVGATSYDVFMSGSLLGNVAGTSANVTGLAAGTSYSFTVRARNAVGSSGNSNTLNASTLGGAPPAQFIWPVLARNLQLAGVFTPGHRAVDIIPINDPDAPCWTPLPPPYLASEGAPVVAAAGGRISEIMRGHDDAGNAFVIAHGGGYFTRYIHLHNSGLRNISFEGRVSQGDVLGLTGRTGTTNNSSGHLHFEIIRVYDRQGASDLDDARLFRHQAFGGMTVESGHVTINGVRYNFRRFNPVTLLPPR